MNDGPPQSKINQQIERLRLYGEYCYDCTL
jgi:hypothetical protein